MATSFAVEILNAKLNANFKGVALGDSWIDPMAFVSEWGPYLYATSEVDEIGLASVRHTSPLPQLLMSAILVATHVSIF
jgi:serine carboxypeptidase 1